MGKRGPQPKPSAIKKLEGNPGKRHVNKREPKPKGQPTPPKMLDKVGKEEFQHLLDISPPGMLTSADVAVMALHADGWSIYTQMRQELEEHGFLAVGSTGNNIASPRLTALKFSAEMVLKTADRLGLSPAVRARLQSPDADKKPPEEESLAKLIAFPGSRKT